MAQSIYDTLHWRLTAARARKRDGSACSVARLLGGDCSAGTPHVHHIRPLHEGGDPYDLDNVATVCAAHHPVWEALRRSVLNAQDRTVERAPRCSHYHRTAAAREECERRLARARGGQHIAA